MKTSKITMSILALVMIFCMLLSACGEKAPAAQPTESAAPTEAVPEKDYAVAGVTLCGTDTNSADFMKGFSIQGTAGDLVADDDVFSFAMCYTTGNLDDVNAFFASERFSDPASFLAEVDALDLAGNIRNLAGDRKAYLDGNVDDPIRYYGDGIDLLNDVSLLQNAGEYHFYIVTIGNEKVLAVSEADRTFTMEQSAIDLANTFASAFDLVTETTLMEGQDVSKLTQDEKTQAVSDYFTEAIGALELGVEVGVTYENDAEYPDDYLVTLTKDGVESSTYVTVYFGEKQA